MMLVFDTSPKLKGGKKDDWVKELQVLDWAEPCKIIEAVSCPKSSAMPVTPDDGPVNTACSVGVAGASSQNSFWLHHCCIEAIQQTGESTYTALQLSIAVLRVVNRIDAEKGGSTWECDNECDYHPYFM